MSESKWIEFTPGEDDASRRLDRVLRKLLGAVPLSRIYAALRKGEVRINGKRAKPGARLTAGDRLEIRAELARESAAGAGGSTRSGSAADGAKSGDRFEDLICFENEAVLACNKPPGVLTHGGENRESTQSLADRAVAYLSAKGSASLSFTSGPMHRLDRNSSGIVLFPKRLVAARAFSSLQAAGETVKQYLAVLAGRMRSESRWEDVLERDNARRVTQAAADDESGRAAVTVVEPVATAQEDGRWYTLARCTLASGRTHQIRAQAALHEAPLEGDVKYGGPRRRGGFTLHAYRLALRSWSDELAFTEIFAAPPVAARELIEYRFGRSALESVAGRMDLQ